jgi:hypothetical protein
MVCIDSFCKKNGVKNEDFYTKADGEIPNLELQKLLMDCFSFLLSSWNLITIADIDGHKMSFFLWGVSW